MAKARAYRESSIVEKPPAFQEYAAQALTAEPVRLMSLAERGLFTTMRWYCWQNDSIPSDPVQMARALGLQAAEVREYLTDLVRTFFEPAEDAADRLVCPALVRQMDRLMLRREAQAQGGRDAARARREKRNQALSNRASNPHATYVGLEKSTAQQSQNQLGREREEKNSLKGNGNAGVPDADFVRGLEAGEAAEPKLRRVAAI